MLLKVGYLRAVGIRSGRKLDLKRTAVFERDRNLLIRAREVYRNYKLRLVGKSAISNDVLLCLVGKYPLKALGVKIIRPKLGGIDVVSVQSGDVLITLN